MPLVMPIRSFFEELFFPDGGFTQFIWIFRLSWCSFFVTLLLVFEGLFSFLLVFPFIQVYAGRIESAGKCVSARFNTQHTFKSFLLPLLSYVLFSIFFLFDSSFLKQTKNAHGVFQVITIGLYRYNYALHWTWKSPNNVSWFNAWCSFLLQPFDISKRNDKSLWKMILWILTTLGYGTVFIKLIFKNTRIWKIINENSVIQSKLLIFSDSVFPPSDLLYKKESSDARGQKIILIFFILGCTTLRPGMYKQSVGSVIVWIKKEV